MRKPFSGVWNIIRFNWHYYVLSLGLIVLVLILNNSFPDSVSIAVNVLLLLVVASTFISLFISWYIYDLSDLYKFSWLNKLQKNDKERILNIHAGFDETSNILKQSFPDSELNVFDFYDPSKHTEVSIRRARKAYPPYRGTQQITTGHLPLNNNSSSKIFAILSAHEIRNNDERIAFFKELHRVLTATGNIIVVEHLRNTANFLAYNVGFFHFHSKATWLRTFQSSGLTVTSELKITPFITAFILNK